MAFNPRHLDGMSTLGFDSQSKMLPQIAITYKAPMLLKLLALNNFINYGISLVDEGFAVRSDVDWPISTGCHQPSS